MGELMSDVEEIWKTQNPGQAYTYFFIDDSYTQLHESDYRFASVFEYAAGIAIFIACLGLLGLSIGSRDGLGTMPLRLVYERSVDL